jgi:hypothetical protein
VAYWWVNQRRSYAAERRAGILWAPTVMADGGTRSYWTAMTELAAGDVVFHYADQRIRAVGRVRTPARLHPRPYELPSQLWQEDGWLAEVDYLDLAAPIHRSEIPIEWRRPRREPCFDRNGDIVVGYLFPVSPEFAGKLLDQFEQRWPPAAVSPMVPPVEARQGAHRLLRRLLGEPLETLTGRPNRVVAVGELDATVATERSPQGSRCRSPRSSRRSISCCATARWWLPPSRSATEARSWGRCCGPFPVPRCGLTLPGCSWTPPWRVMGGRFPRVTSMLP